EKDFGTIRIKTVITRLPVSEDNVLLFQYLDVLRDIKKIPDADINQSIRAMKEKLAQLDIGDRQRLVQFAVAYYNPQVRALLASRATSIKWDEKILLKTTLNPTTTYKLALNAELWPAARDWNIQ